MNSQSYLLVGGIRNCMKNQPWELPQRGVAVPIKGHEGVRVDSQQWLIFLNIQPEFFGLRRFLRCFFSFHHAFSCSNASLSILKSLPIHKIRRSFLHPITFSGGVSRFKRQKEEKFQLFNFPITHISLTFPPQKACISTETWLPLPLKMASCVVQDSISYYTRCHLERLNKGSYSP